MFGRLSAFDRWVGVPILIRRAGNMPGAGASTGLRACLAISPAPAASRAGRPAREVRISGVEEIVHGPRRGGVDARRLHQVLEGRALDGFDRAEMVQERALARRPDPGDLVERVLDQLALALGPVGPDGEAVRLVAQALHEVQGRVPRWHLERGLAGLEER